VAAMARLTDLPQEIIMEIVSYLDHTSDFLSLTLACKATSPVALGRLYQEVFYYYDSPEAWPIGIQKLARLTRTLSGSDLSTLVQKLSLYMTSFRNAVEAPLLSTLLNLVAPSVLFLDIDTVSLRTIQTLPALPLLRRLDISHNELEHPRTSTTESLENLIHLPALRHLSMCNIQSFSSERFDTFLQSVPALKSLRMEIYDRELSSDQSREETLLPLDLARSLQPLQTTLEDLLYEYSEDTGLDRDLSVINGCLSCHIGSFAEFTKLRRLAIPLDWLLCNENLIKCPQHDILKPISPIECLPLSLEVLRLQLPYNWPNPQEFYGRCYKEVDDFGSNQDDQQTPILFVSLRMILNELRQHLPVLRQVQFYFDYCLPLDFDILGELFLEHMPSMSEDRAAGFQFDWTRHACFGLKDYWPMDSRERRLT